jgi:hypothetical protein
MAWQHRSARHLVKLGRLSLLIADRRGRTPMARAAVLHVSHGQLTVSDPPGRPAPDLYAACWFGLDIVAFQVRV